jgi:hypothetical protein
MKRRNFIKLTAATGVITGIAPLSQVYAGNNTGDGEKNIDKHHTPTDIDAKELFVSPAGNDGNPGTRRLPFETIARARDKVRDLNKHTTNENIIVWLAGGEYRLTETLVFGMDDSAKLGQTITYCALPGEKPVISSDVPVSGWKKLKDRPKGLPRNAVGKLWVAEVPASVGSFKVLFNSGGMMPRAKTAGIAHLRKVDEWVGSDEERTTIPFKKETVDELFNPRQAEISVVGAAPWTMNILPVKSVDVNTGMVQLAATSTYAMAAPRYYFGPETIWVENTFAGLDTPGKWLFDEQSRLLYLWPADNKRPGNDIVAPKLIELVRVEGNINYDSPVDEPVKGLVFKGLTFTHGNRFNSAGATGWGLQHDWERFDASTAMLRFRGSENCVVEGCSFINSGGAGIRFDLYAQQNKVIDNEISELGGAGILLVGYGPGTKDVNKNNIISNNHIHHTGLLWWHALGIWAWQSGHNVIAHNTIHNMSYTAIAVTGRINWDKSGKAECSRTVRWAEVDGFKGGESWEERERFLHSRQNVLEQNDIKDVMEVMQDGNGIYISGTGHGNVVRGNFVHDTYSMAAGEAIRCDDDQNEVLIENNIVYKYGTHGVGICTKGRNHIFNNIVALPPNRVNRGMLSFESDVRNTAGSRVLHNIFYGGQAKQPFVYNDGIKQDVSGIVLDRNIYFNTSDPKAADDYLKWAVTNGVEVNSLQVDPLFVDAVNGNFELKPGSPAIKLGFRPFTIEPGVIKRS